ncbi:hypothetical protein VAR608DRAFT_4896 [Variovorax sp. HW608]|uniref:hypothetical protein n=1 Tax=Variovorax sp. HW608 TaxID=1034889 RepID=UPI00081F8729|nr:hypothetical protein [Variovorax sp. HW608]SCK49209.1 hypothetical protein VAR608DRAFT_4896 [Variovorax sp. HW608]
MTDTAIVALLVGLVAALLAAEQWKVARAKLRLDLFEKRYALYEILWAHLSARVGDHADIKEKSRALQNSIPQFYFLFGDSIGDFAREALSKGIYQDTATRVSKGFGTAEAVSKANNDLTEHYSWFMTEVDKMRQRFAPYLGFEEWQKI